MAFTRFDGIPAIYRHVAALPEAVLVEFPFPEPVVIQDNGPYVLASTVHFRPMLNGYSGFTPASYYLHAAVAQRFPSAESLREFGLLGATHIVVHGARLGAGGDRAVGGDRTRSRCSPAKGTIGSTRSSRRRRDLAAPAAALAVAAVLAVLHTWPLARDVAGQSRLDNADTALNTWIVSWVAHQLPRDPRRVFDAPIFHPERRTLAYSEPLLAPGAMAMPLRAAGLSATATYNLLVPWPASR